MAFVMCHTPFIVKNVVFTPFRSGDPHMKEGLFLHINLRNEHNHQELSAGAVIRRNVSVDTIEKLKQLFESGHTPSSALKVLKSDLKVEDKDGEVFDRSVCPDLQFCYRLVTYPISYK